MNILHPVPNWFQLKTLVTPTQGAVWLKTNGELRQEGDLNQLIWKIPEMISYLSDLFTLHSGDIILSGTPSGVGPVQKGDQMHGYVEGVGELKVNVNLNTVVIQLNC